MSDTPKALNRIDLKTETIDNFDYLLENTRDPDNRRSNLVVFTNFALIKGRLVSMNDFPNEDDRSPFEIILVKALELRNERIKELDDQARVVNDGTFILLKDVTITPYSNAGIGHQIHEMVLFSDQIVGFSAD